MSFVADHKTGKVIEVPYSWKATGYRPDCEDCGGDNVMYSTALRWVNSEDIEVSGGWLCMDCGMPQEYET
jgi:hypothetical protein